MKKQHILLRGFILFVLVVGLAGCRLGNQQEAVANTPTVEVVQDETVVAATEVMKQTIVAALATVNALGTPSPTAENTQAAAATNTAPAADAATATTAPTATDAAATTPTPDGTTTATPLIQGTPTLISTGTATPIGGAGNAKYPTKTPRLIPDNAVVIASTPYDGTKFNAGNQFDAKWTLRNTGTTTWTSDYHIREVGKTKMGESDRYYLGGEVRPGETVDIFADLVAPNEGGVQVSYWEFVNGNGDIIIRVYAAITVE